MIVVLILLCAGLLTGAEIVRSACCLTVSHYALRSGKVTRQLRVLQLSDLHNAQHGSENRRLLRLAAEQAPDLILFTGDLVTGTLQIVLVTLDFFPVQSRDGVQAQLGILLLLKYLGLKDSGCFHTLHIDTSLRPTPAAGVMIREVTRSYACPECR